MAASDSESDTDSDALSSTSTDSSGGGSQSSSSIRQSSSRWDYFCGGIACEVQWEKHTAQCMPWFGQHAASCSLMYPDGFQLGEVVTQGNLNGRPVFTCVTEHSFAVVMSHVQAGRSYAGPW